MDYETALKTIKGAESVGGQLIVNRDGKNILVGKNVQGLLIVEDGEEAKLVYAEATGVAVADIDGDDAPTPTPVTHEVKVADNVDAKDKLKK